MLSSREVCQLVGCSYRQLDYAVRISGAAPVSGEATPGSGHRRGWSHEQVARLAIANHLAGSPATGGFSVLAAAALDADLPEPPAAGYAVALPGDPRTMVTWVGRWPDVRPIVDLGRPLIVVAYDLDDLIDLAALDTETVPR